MFKHYLGRQKVQSNFKNWVTKAIGLNDVILESEVSKSVVRTKNNKLVGIDGLSNEIYKSNVSIGLLTVLFIFNKNYMNTYCNLIV